MWAIEQDDLSKRHVPDEFSSENTIAGAGRDVFVPWVLSTPKAQGQSKSNTKSERQVDIGDPPDNENNKKSQPPQPQIFNRYYHMFAPGELAELVRSAASDMGLYVGPQYLAETQAMLASRGGVEILQDGWERSNYYVELRRWQI